MRSLCTVVLLSIVACGDDGGANRLPDAPVPADALEPDEVVDAPALPAGQVGTGIAGEVAGDQSGNAVALSADGRRVVIGAMANGGNGTQSGHVRVFDWNGTAWVQVGADIDGENANDRLGGTVSITDDGTRIAVGAYGADAPALLNTGHVRVFDWSGTAWVQVGADIDGPVAGTGYGSSIALNASGTRLVIGATHNNSANGEVVVYDLVGDVWTQLGTKISGDHEFGADVDISNDGTRIVLSSPSQQSSDGFPGRVQVYELVGADWAALGAPLMGEQAGDYFGGSLALSADGDRLLVGAENNDGGGVNAGHVRVFEWNGTAWSQVGGDLDGLAGGQLGWSVAISADGSRVVAGAPTGTGALKVYDLVGSAWTQPTTPDFGMGGRMGDSVAIAADGHAVALGAIYQAANGSASGEVRIYGI